MDVSLDYINKVIARNNASKQAGAQEAPASSSGGTGSMDKIDRQMQAKRERQASAETEQQKIRNTIQTNEKYRNLWALEHGTNGGAEAIARRKEQATAMRQLMSTQEINEYDQMAASMEEGIGGAYHNNQPLNAYQLYLQEAEQQKNAFGQEKRADQYNAVQQYLGTNEKARALWDAEHTPFKSEEKIGMLRDDMSAMEQEIYDAALKARQEYGGTPYEIGKNIGYIAKSAGTGLVSGIANLYNNLIDTDQAVRELMARYAENTGTDTQTARAQNRAWYEQQRQIVRPASQGALPAFEDLSPEQQETILQTGPYATVSMKRANAYRQDIAGAEAVRGTQMIGGNSLEELGKLAGTYQEESGKTGALQLAGNVASGIGGMVPNIAANMAGMPTLGWWTLYAGAAGGSAQEARDAGADPLTAGVAGALSGAVEMATEKMFDGIPGMSQGNRFAVSDAVEKGIQKYIKSETGKKVAGKLADVLGEGAEEYVSELAGSYIAQLYQEDERTFLERASDPDTWYAFLTGSVTSGVMNAGAGVIRAATSGNTEARNPAKQNAEVAQEEKTEQAGELKPVQQTENVDPLQELIPSDTALDTLNESSVQGLFQDQMEDESPETYFMLPEPFMAGEGDAADPQAGPRENPGMDILLNEPYLAGETGVGIPAETAKGQSLQENTKQDAGTEDIRNWARENESFDPEMRMLADESYKPGINTSLYKTAIQNFYDAGRSGALSYEQAMELNENRAAALQQDDVLRKAWEQGRKMAQTVEDVPGAGRGDGQVQYEEGTEPGARIDDTVLQAVAQKLGVNIRVMQQLTDDTGGPANGRWAAAMGEIALGENTSNAYQTLSHELTHYMGSYNPEGWQRLRSSALQWYAQQGGQQTGEAITRYEAAYGDYAKGADEAARDVLSGVMSTEDGVRSFLEYLSEDTGTTVQEKKTILQTLREMLDMLLEKVRGLLQGGDATLTAAQARQMAERADQLEARRILINDYLYELDNARQNAEQAGLQSNASKNAPAASRSEEYSINPEFDREIREWDAEGRNGRKIFTLGATGEALKSIGVRDRSIVMVSDKVRKILRDHPSMTMDMIRQIPAMLEDPALVLESRGGSMLPGTKQNSRIVVVGTVTDAQGDPVICALDLAPSSRQDMELGLQDFNKVSSAYAKDRNAGKMLQNSNVLYASPDTKITKAALSSFGFQFATSELNRLGSMGRITYDGGKVKMQGVPFEEVFGGEERTGGKEYSRPVSQEDELDRLIRERDAWMDSDEVRSVRAAYERERQMYGLFGGQLKEWKSNNPAWQDYESRRKDYNQRISALREERRRGAEDDRAAAEQRAEERWKEEQTRQRSYDAARQESGLSVEDYHREQAVRKYKTTTDANKAGYLLPDGRMLDFSGGDTRRAEDHREIKDIFGPAELERDAKPTQYMNRFIAEGNVRVMAENPGVDMSAETPPTRQQLREIEKMVDTLGVQNGHFSIDISRADGSQAAAREYNGRVRGREIVRDIEAYYRDGKLPEQSELNQYRYSRKAMELDTEQRRRRAAETENRKLVRENTRMADQIELLKQETRLSGGHLMDTEAVHEVAARMVKNANSRYDVAQLERELRRVYESMSRGKVGSVQEAMETLNDLARGVLSEQRPGMNRAREAYKPLLDKVRSADWTVREGSPLYQDLLDLYGNGPNGKSWGNVRKALFGRIDIKKTGESGTSGRIDALFDELAEEWPGIFDKDAAPADNIQRLMEVYDEVRDGAAYDLETGMSEEEEAAYLAQDLYDAYLAMPRRQTYADRSAAQAEKVAQQFRQEKAQAMAQQKAAYEQKLQEQRKWARDRMAELQNRYKAAQEAHDQELVIKTHNQIVKARQQAKDTLLRRRAALEMQWSNKRERADVTQQRQRVQKSVQALHRWLMKPTAQQHVQTKMQGAVLNLLNSLNMNVGREGTGTAARWQETMKDIQLMAKDALAADGGLTDTDAYADFDPDLPEMISELMAGTETLDVQKMNSRQLKQLADVLTSMQTSIRNANKMMSDAQGRTVDEIARQSAEEMEQEAGTLLKNRYTWAGKAAESRLGNAAGQLLGLDMMDARRYFTSLGETARQKIYEPIRKGFDKRVWLLASAQDAFDDIVGETDISQWTGDRAPAQKFELHDGKTIRLTVGQRMELYNLSQRQQAHEHLMQGGFTLVDSQGDKKGKRVNITPADLAKIVGSLTNEQVQIARKMSDYLSAKDGPAGWGNEVSRQLYGLDKFNERHYWPIKSDSNQTRTSDATDGGTAGFWAIKNQGHTKAIKKHANNSVLVGDAFDTWANHVANMATYNAWSVPLSDAMKWYNWKSGTDVSTKEEVEVLYGKKGKEFFTTLIKDINGVVQKPAATGFSKILKPITRNWKVAKVSANLRVAVQQPTAYIRAAAVMNPKYLVEGLAADVTKLRHGMQMAEDHCAIAKWKSWGYFETNLGQSMKTVLTGEQTALDSVREAGTKLAELGDQVTWGTLWNACEAEARAKGMKAGTDSFNQYCADRLSEIVDKTQVVDSVLHRSQLMRNPGDAAQMSTNFFAEPTKSYSMMAEAWMDMMHGKEGAKKNFARATATYALTALGTAAAASLIDAVRVSSDDDRDKDYKERYLKNLWENFQNNINPLNNIPLVKDILSIAQGYDATRSDMEMFSDALSAVGAIQKAPEGDITPYRLTYQVATALSSLTGIPMSSAVREAKSAYDMVTDLQDPLRLDRKMNRDEEDYSYIDLYNQVKAAGGDKDEFKALYQGKTYEEMLGTDKAKAVDSWVQALAENSSKDGEVNKDVLPTHLDNEISYTDSEGTEHKVVLKGPDYIQYAKSLQSAAVNLIDEYMRSVGATATTDEQARFVKLAKEYAKETARETVIPGYEAKDWVVRVRTLSGGENVAEMILARQIVSNAEGEKDEEGKTISGSKAANAVDQLQQSLGYSAGEAQALYNNLRGSEENTYMRLYKDVEGSKTEVDKLAALYGTGETATYAGMLQNSGAATVDSYLQSLSKSQGKEVLPDRAATTFTAGEEEVALDGKQYIEYANSRTQTAYNILNELVPYAGNYTKEEQAGFVLKVEDYATQIAKAEVSDFEPYKWMQEVQQRAGNDSQQLYSLIMAKTLIDSAEGQKGANGKTISGSKKAAALQSMQDAGYSAAMAQQMYKLFS